jgi:hypothetical protein
MAWRGPLYALSGVVILGSVILEYGWEFRFLAWGRAAIMTGLVMWNLRPYRSPLARTTLAWCVWAAHWLLIAASWLVAAMPKYQIDLLHVMFTGVHAAHSGCRNSCCAFPWRPFSDGREAIVASAHRIDNGACCVVSASRCRVSSRELLLQSPCVGCRALDFGVIDLGRLSSQRNSIRCRGLHLTWNPICSWEGRGMNVELYYSVEEKSHDR